MFYSCIVNILIVIFYILQLFYCLNKIISYPLFIPTCRRETAAEGPLLSSAAVRIAAQCVVAIREAKGVI